MGDFPIYDWTKFYGDAKEAMPADMPFLLGKDVDLQMMVDSEHEINGSDDPGLASLYFVTWPLSIGNPRSNRPLKHQSLVPNLLL